jgi:hypothetical protein
MESVDAKTPFRTPGQAPPQHPLTPRHVHPRIGQHRVRVPPPPWGSAGNGAGWGSFDAARKTGACRQGTLSCARKLQFNEAAASAVVHNRLAATESRLGMRAGRPPLIAAGGQLTFRHG